jgi:sterol desaturase/sphingolipid hydroxylase (fatty acid hydroxylase superfamily)
MFQSFVSQVIRYVSCPLLEQRWNEVSALHSCLFIIVLSMACFEVAYLQTLSCRTFIRVMMNIIWGAAAHCLLLMFTSLPVSDVHGRDYSIQAFLRKVFLGYVFADVMYYSIHRVLHLKFFYRRIHRLHHETQQTGPLTALDVHPIEYVFAQMSTELMSAWMVGATLPELCFLSSVAKVFAMYSHSRSDGKAWISVMEHEAHHRDGRHNFGVTGMMDWAFGTIK